MISKENVKVIQQKHPLVCSTCKKELTEFFRQEHSYYCPQCMYDLLTKELSYTVKIQIAAIPFAYVALFFVFLIGGGSDMAPNIKLLMFILFPIISGGAIIFIFKIVYRIEFKRYLIVKKSLEKQKQLKNT